MNIQTPTIKNRGIFTKKVKVTLERPEVDRWKNIGVVPESERWATAPEAPRTPNEVFVPSTQEQPARIPGFRDKNVTVDAAPVLSEDGKPVMKSEEVTLRVPGPKGEALGNIAMTTLMGGLVGAVPGMFGMGLGMLGALLGGRAAGDILEGASSLFVGGLAVGGALGFVGGAVGARDGFTATNTLNWEKTPIETSTLKGYNRVSEEKHGRHLETFSPVIEKNKVGEYMKPVITARNYGM